MDDEKHYPPGAEPVIPATEPETPTPADPAPEEQPTPPAEATPEVPTPETPAEPPTPPEPETPPITKKRSIYDDLKDKRQESKDLKSIAVTALKTMGVEVTGNETVDQLQALLNSKKNATTPAETKTADDELKDFAEKEGLTPEQIDKFATIIAARLPKPATEGMTPEELTAWRASQTTAKQADEDRQVLVSAPTVKEQLGVQDDKELDNVMKEVVRLSHTPEYHDKEVDYIVWKNKDKLSKLVSPKKPSFESGTPSNKEGADEPVDFGSGKVTPAQAQKAITPQRSSYEVRKST